MASGRISKLREIFSNLASSDSISLEKSDKWMAQARILGDKITQRDTARAFQKFKEEKLDFDTYMNYLNDLAKSKDVDLSEIQAKLSNTNTKILTDGVSVKADKIMDKLDRMTAHPVGKKASDIAASVYDKTPSFDEVKKQAVAKTEAVKSEFRERAPVIDQNISAKTAQAQEKIGEIVPKIEKKLEETATVAKGKFDHLAPNYSKQIEKKADAYIDKLAAAAPDVKNVVKESTSAISRSVDEKNHPRLSRLIRKASDTTNSLVGQITDKIKSLTKKEREKNKDKE